MSRTDPAQRNPMKMLATVMAWLYRWGADAGRALVASLDRGTGEVATLVAPVGFDGGVRRYPVSVVPPRRGAAGLARRSSLARGRPGNRLAAMTRFGTF
jgi:hypothetical protein